MSSRLSLMVFVGCESKVVPIPRKAYQTVQYVAEFSIPLRYVKTFSMGGERGGWGGIPASVVVVFLSSSCSAFTCSIGGKRATSTACLGFRTANQRRRKKLRRLTETMCSCHEFASRPEYPAGQWRTASILLPLGRARTLRSRYRRRHCTSSPAMLRCSTPPCFSRPFGFSFALCCVVRKLLANTKGRLAT